MRRVTGYQDFVDDAPLVLVYVADHRRLHAVPAASRSLYSAAAAGAICQNVYLYAAAHGGRRRFARGFIAEAIADALGLSHDQQVLFSQTIGYPAA